MRWIVGESVVDLRAEPCHASSTMWEDTGLHTQLLFGEPVEWLDEQEEWVYVGALAQPRHHQGRWQSYEGWVPKASLLQTAAPELGVHTGWWTPVRQSPDAQGEVLWRMSPGSFLVGELMGPWIHLDGGGYLKLPSGRAASLEALANRWLGSPYVWGGTSGYLPQMWPQRSGVDCSGLVHLLERCAGRCVPRDAHDQWLACTPLRDLEQVAPGDYLFFGPEDPDGRIHHVLLAITQHRLLESSRSLGGVVQQLTRLRCRVGDEPLRNGTWNQEHRVYMGRMSDQLGS